MAKRATAGDQVEPLIELYGAGHEDRTEGYYHDSARRVDRTHVNIQLTLRGEGFYRSNRETFNIPPGFAYIDIIPGSFEYGTLPRGAESRYEHTFVSLGGPVATRWCRRIVKQFGNVLDLSPATALREQMLSIARRHWNNDLPDRYLLSARLYEIVMTIFSELSGRRLETTPRVGRAIDLIVQSAKDPAYQIETLAEQLDCSREYLARQFQQTVRVSPLEYLTRQRVKLAASMLRDTEDKLEAIARQSGFSSANYLCRVFRQRVGLTPAEFRKRRWVTVG